MTTKNVCVIVPDKVVSVDGESYVLDTWSFGDSKIWAIQWDGSTKTGDIEPAPVNGKIEGGNEDLTAQDYDTKVKHYVDAWEVQKAKVATAISEEDKKESDATAAKIANRAAVRKLGKIPIENRLPIYPSGVDSI
tara:strand:+ start:1074 stop:1478 length:405 start_codon:yes stop_codon:yes gene_type:complete